MKVAMHSPTCVRRLIALTSRFNQTRLQTKSVANGFPKIVGSKGARVSTVSAQPSPADPQPSKLLLVDATSILHKAHYYYLDDTQSDNDVPLVRAFFSVLLDVLEGLEPLPTHLAIVLGGVGPRSGGVYQTPLTHRHELHSDYQPHWANIPKDVAYGAAALKALLDIMQIPTFQVAGADPVDVIATISSRIVNSGCQTCILSSDRMFRQLLAPDLYMVKHCGSGYSSNELEVYTLDDFHEEWDIEPAKYPDVLAMVGNVREGVPGVKRIGEATARKLMAQNGSLYDVIAGAPQMKGKTAREAFTSEAGIANAYLSQQLMTLRTDVDIPVTRTTLEALLWHVPEDGGRQAMQQLEAMRLPPWALKRMTTVYLDVAARTAAASKRGQKFTTKCTGSA